jgi:hypothetical protein
LSRPPFLIPRLARLSAGVAAALLLAGAAAAAPAEPPHLVRDPHYGDGLFHFYQGRYFTSVTGLMASQQFERMPRHVDEAELLRGGLLLSYGLHREAEQIFVRLIDQGAKPAVRDRAWFFVAKIRYQRGLHAEAETAINRIQGKLPTDLEEERGLLHANLLMARGDNAGAARVLGGMTSAKSVAARYARYNLGAALVRAGDVAGGTRWLDELGQAPAPDEETRALRDQANVALGFAALKSENPRQARAYLERVRLTGMHAGKALLGFGWAAAAMKQPWLALAPWLELINKRNASEAAVLEARIAVAYAHAEMGAEGQALALYEQALAEFEKEDKALDESIAALRTGKWIDELVERNPGEEMGWFWQVGKLPQGLPHAGHLTPLLASHTFQEALKNHRDLLFLAKNLREGAEKVGVFGDMLANRRQAFAERLPVIRAQASKSGIDALRQRTDTLVREVAVGEAAADGVAFADAKQRDLLQRLVRVNTALAAMPADAPESVAARDRARLAAGALTWQLAQAQPARLWDAKKALKKVDTDLAAARARDAALAQAERDEPARFEGFAMRREQREEMQDLAVAELQRQKERLVIYTNQARLAMAQLYDRAEVPKGGVRPNDDAAGGGHAVKP